MCVLCVGVERTKGSVGVLCVGVERTKVKVGLEKNSLIQILGSNQSRHVCMGNMWFISKKSLPKWHPKFGWEKKNESRRFLS